MGMNKLLIEMFLYLLAGNVMAWYQLQGQFLSGAWGDLFKKSWIPVVTGIPIGYFFWRATTLSYEYFGAVWNLRLIGFGFGTIIFGLMTGIILKELPGWHTIISLILALAIILIQFSNLTLK